MKSLIKKILGRPTTVPPQLTSAQERALSFRASFPPDSLTAIADAHSTDKGTMKHNYTQLYGLLFQHVRHSEITILEMGLQIGGPDVPGVSADRETTDVPSVRMWLDYFTKARVIGADVSDFSWVEDDRFTFVQCDMDDRRNFEKIKSVASDASIIIDDASHASSHQQFAFLELFPLLPHGGIYIIEDLQWQPEIYESKRPSFPKTSELLMQFLNDGYFRHPESGIEDELNELVENISGVFMFQHKYISDRRHKIAVIHKR